MMKRTFIAIKIPISESAESLIQEIKLQLNNEKIKWVESWNLHITLFFLGNTEEVLIDKLCNKLTECLKDVKSFNLKCKGVGVFKNTNNPKVFWLGLEESEYLQKLKLDIDKIMKSFSFRIDKREYKPHITLGRIKYIKDKSQLKKVIEKHKEQEIQDFNINSVLFYESKLTPKGPIYSVLKTFTLN